MAVVYPYNQAVQDTWRTYDFDGTTLTDPTTVSFYLIDPAGTRTDYLYGTDSEVTRATTGTYVFTGVNLDQPGTWQWGWFADGDIATSREGKWTVGNTNLP